MSLAPLLQILLLTFSVLVFSCTPKGEGILNNKSSFSEAIDNATKQAPFAYDIAADTISYNSCVNFVADTGSTNNPVPGLIVGVNEGFVTTNGNGAVKAGLKLRTQFLQHIGRYLKPQAPSLTVTPEQVQRVLQLSPANAGAYMQYSIRRKTDLALNIDLISPGANNNLNSLIPQPNRDAIVFLQDLTTGFVGRMLTKDIKYTGSGTVLSEGPRTYNLSDTPDPVPIQGSFGVNQTADETLPISTDTTSNNPEIKFGVGEYYSDLIRKRFNSTSNDRVILTAVFGGKALDAAFGTENSEESISQIRRQTTDVSKAFGRAYSLKFTPKVTNVAGWVNNVLSGTAVTEFDLATGTTVQGAQWTCENFLIVLPSHYDNKKLTEPTCSPLLSTDMSEARQLAVKKIRRQHAAADWNIGLFIPKDQALGVTVADRIANRANYQICVSPRRSSCYLPTTQIFSLAENQSKDAGIQYDTSQECYLTAFNLMGANYTNAATPDAKRLLGRCANYLSVCTRSSTNF